VIDELVLPTPLGVEDLVLRSATMDDLDALILLMSDDAVSAARGDRADAADRTAYEAGLADVLRTPNNALIVVADVDDRVVATLQLTVLPGMARQGARRLQVEAVRVSSSIRSGGIGSAMMRWGADVAAPAAQCTLIQLTSDRARVDAHRFYERLGYAGSHIGFKRSVPTVASHVD